MKIRGLKYKTHYKKDNKNAVMGIQSIHIMLTLVLSPLMYFWDNINGIEVMLSILFFTFISFLITIAVLTFYLEKRAKQDLYWFGYKTYNFLFRNFVKLLDKSNYSFIKFMNKMPWKKWDRKILDIFQNNTKNLENVTFDETSIQREYGDYKYFISKSKSYIKDKNNKFYCNVCFKDKQIADIEIEIDPKSNKISEIDLENLEDNNFNKEIKKSFPLFKKEFDTVLKNFIHNKSILETNQYSKEDKESKKNYINTSNIQLLSENYKKEIQKLKHNNNEWINESCDELKTILQKMEDSEKIGIDHSNITEIVFSDLAPLIIENIVKYKFLNKYKNASNQTNIQLEQATKKLLEALNKCVDNHIDSNIHESLNKSNLKLDVYQHINN